MYYDEKGYRAEWLDEATHAECTHCEGTGEDMYSPEHDPEPCPHCGGYGVIDLRG